MKELELYDEVIKERLKEAKDLEPGTKEREAFDRETNALIQMSNELIKITQETSESSLRRLNETEIEKAKLEEEKKNRWTQVALRVAGGIGTTAVLLYVMVSDQIFSETGTTTSILGKTVLQTLARPFKR